MPHPDVVVVGCGVIGASIAYYLASGGAKVVILERGQAGGHASRASAGLLHPISDPDAPEAFRLLSDASFAMFSALVAAIREQTGIDAGLRQVGWLRVALQEAAADDLRARFRVAAPHGHLAEWLSPEEVWAMEPNLSTAAVAGLRLPAGAQVNARMLQQGLLEAAARRGAKLRIGAEAASFVVQTGAVAGVTLSDGEVVLGGHTVVAAGAWSAGLLNQLGLSTPVRPLRGQIILLQARPPQPLSQIVFCSDVYLSPQVDGSTILGATYEDVGFDDRPTAVGLSFLLLNGIRVAPAYANATFLEARIGLRPSSPDGMPILGAVPGWDGVSLAIGHSADGVLLSPITGLLIAQRVLGQSPDMSLEPFSLHRFGQ